LQFTGLESLSIFNQRAGLNAGFQTRENMEKLDIYYLYYLCEEALHAEFANQKDFYIKAVIEAIQEIEMKLKKNDGFI
jgi:hypothetical protein